MPRSGALQVWANGFARWTIDELAGLKTAEWWNWRRRDKAVIDQYLYSSVTETDDSRDIREEIP